MASSWTRRPPRRPTSSRRMDCKSSLPPNARSPSTTVALVPKFPNLALLPRRLQWTPTLVPARFHFVQGLVVLQAETDPGDTAVVADELVRGGVLLLIRLG